MCGLDNTWLQKRKKRLLLLVQLHAQALLEQIECNCTKHLFIMYHLQKQVGVCVSTVSVYVFGNGD